MFASGERSSSAKLRMKIYAPIFPYAAFAIAPAVEKCPKVMVGSFAASMASRRCRRVGGGRKKKRGWWCVGRLLLEEEEEGWQSGG